MDEQDFRKKSDAELEALKKRLLGVWATSMASRWKVAGRGLNCCLRVALHNRASRRKCGL
jgi:hypothetical protein